MKTYKQLLETTKSKHAVLVFGRFQPPTIGHAKVIEHALATDGDPHIVVSHSQNSKTDPLTADEKVDILKKMYPHKAKHFSASNTENPTIFHKLGQLHQDGYTHVTVVTGADRQKEFQDKLNEYNGKFKVSGDGKTKKGYAFNKIKVMSAGERNPDAQGAEGISGTKLRQAALNGDFGTMRKNMHSNITDDHIHQLISKIQTRTKKQETPKPDKIKVSESYLNEELYFGKPLKSLREEYKTGKLYAIGDMVECNDGQIAEVVNLGTNYVTLLSEGKTFKSWLPDIKKKIDAQIKVPLPISKQIKAASGKGVARKALKALTKEGFEFKGYVPKHLNEEQIKLCDDIKNHQDVYAVLNFIKAFDNLQHIENIDENFNFYKTEFDRLVKYLNKFDIPLDVITTVEDTLLEYSILENSGFKAADQLKVAKIIATTAGHNDHSGKAHEIINRAAAQFKTGRHTPEAWRLFGSMLNHGSTAGIKWNKDIFHSATQKAMGIK